MNRIESIDTVKFFAITAVIAIHANPFSGTGFESNPIWTYLNIAINQFARFAVPFFFVISGYLWGDKIRSGASVSQTSSKSIRRIGLLFLFWCGIYAAINSIYSIAEYGILGPIKIAYWSFSELSFTGALSLILQGSKVHLWFLPALLFAIAISAAFVSRKQTSALIALSAGLYIFGVLSRAYTQTPIGISTDFDTRNGPFFSTALFVGGYVLSSVKPRQEWFLIGIGIALLGYLIHFSEVLLLWEYFDIFPDHDFVAGTFLLGIGFGMVALSNHRSIQSGFPSRFGKYTLGIYAIHFFFTKALKPVGNALANPLWEISVIALILLISTLIAVKLSHTRFGKALVT